MFISQVAAISCADTALPDSSIFQRAAKREVFGLKSRSYVLNAFVVH